MKYFLPVNAPFAGRCWLLMLLSLLVGAATALAQPPADVSDSLQPILPLDDVRVGMKGYGLTVYHGTEIEAFPVEVISVMQDFGPRRGVIWIRCPDERMQQSGPVQGMSGSPIYLWDENEPQTMGQGGKLIGAFAYGFALTTDCYAGVQPIELMREAAQRLGQETAAAAGSPASTASSPQSLGLLLKQARNLGLGEQHTWQARTLHQLLTRDLPADQRMQAGDVAEAGPPAAMQPFGHDQAIQLMLPMAVPSGELVSLLGPVLEPMGLKPMQTPSMTAGQAPPWIDPEQIPIKGGSVLSIPLVWGDMDLSAAGTVTEVWPNGRVLAFGHGMFSQGATALPMASGFVHLVIPSLNTSFKLSGSGVIRGTLGRDEHSAVIGSPDMDFTTAPLTVSVKMPGQPARDYHYQLAHHRDLTPMLAAIATMRSVTAVQEAPSLSTLRLKARMTFQGDRELNIATLLPNWAPMHMLMSLVPAMAAMSQNPHESMMLTSMQVEAQVEPTVKGAMLAQGWLERPQVAPGQTAGITVRLQPYGQPAIQQRLSIAVPENLPDGDYPLVVCDAATYVQLLLASRPHLAGTTSADELHAIVDRILSVSNDQLYVMLQLPEEGLAVGRQEMSQLPSSRRALLESPTSTLVRPYRDWVETAVPMELAIEGQMAFQLQVRSTPKTAR